MSGKLGLNHLPLEMCPTTVLWRHLGKSNMLLLPLQTSVVSVEKLCEEPELLLPLNKNPPLPLAGVSEGQVGNLDFHPYLTVTRCHP